ncbi:hypothetical protein ACAG26_24270 [Mycobacterium sp. pUA109]|uniref:hypothetical protein n=1 Tax=Mycobacterium sp. pUA109 TaxID=3238982 RepID=UPI00351BAC75
MTRDDVRGHLHHMPVVGTPAPEGETRAMVVFDATGRKIAASPHVKIEQTEHTVSRRGVVTTTLKITPIKPPKGD